MLNLPSISPFLHNIRNFMFLATAILLTGCQTMPWSENNSSADVTLQPAETPSIKKPPPSLSQDRHAAGPDNQISQADSGKPVIIWERLRKGFALDKPENKRLQREYDWYLKHPEHLARVLDRAEPFIHYILNEVERRQLPAELVLLPVIESAYQPLAYSPGRAAGLWQFIPSTGRMYGLEQNWWYDGRRDIVASTNAALDYLALLSKKFDGDWELALAAYNAGAGNVRKAIRKNRKKNKPTDYWSLELPRETLTYVPRLLAVSKIFEDAEKLGITLKPIPDTERLAFVSMDSQVDLAKAADMAGISIEEIYRLNPAFNRWATSPNDSFKLVLPVNSKAVFEQKLAMLDDKDLMQWQRYKIKNGDTLSQIAKNHATTTSIIRDVNKLKSSRIRAGNHLLIPVSFQLSNNDHLSIVQDLQKPPKHISERIEHIIKSGDTLWDLARKHKVSHKKIATWNNLKPGKPLKLGQKLVIWSKRNQQATQVAFSAGQTNPTSNVRYTIRKGDSLWRIASKYNVSVNDLKKWNDLDHRYLKPGQTLKLRVVATEQL